MGCFLLKNFVGCSNWDFRLLQAWNASGARHQAFREECAAASALRANAQASGASCMGSGPAPVELGVWTAPRPAPAAELAMSVSFVNPPAAEIARRVLPRVIRRGGPANRGSVRAALHEAWVSEHKVVTEKPGPVPKLRSDQKSLSSRTICARIGRCVCVRTGRSYNAGRHSSGP